MDPQIPEKYSKMGATQHSNSLLRVVNLSRLNSRNLFKIEDNALRDPSFELLGNV